MIKKILLAIISILVTARLIPFALIISSDTSLPWLVIASSLIICFYGIYVIAKGILKKVNLKEIIFYFSIEAIIVFLNLLYCKFILQSSLNIWEILFVGNVLTVIVNPIVVFLLSKKQKYIKINW